jgi:GT2 family glycosyltransferase
MTTPDQSAADQTPADRTRADRTTPSVACVVLNYNGRDVTLEALGSLTRMDYPAYDVIVVDNGSTDGSYEAIAERFPQVVQVRTEENLGPAGGANLGLRHALARDDDYVLILNNDIEVARDLLAEMVRVAESAPEIGIVAPKSYYYWDRERIWSAGGRMVFREAATKERGTGELDRGQYDRDEEIGYVNGCAQLVKRAVFEQIGLWDPLFHLSFEDADFCMRARRRGWRCWFAHRARLWHMVSVTAGGYRESRTYHTARSTAIFIRRYAGPLQRLWAVVMILASLPVAFLRELPRRNVSAVRGKVRGFRDGFFRTRLTEPPPMPTREPDGGDGGAGTGVPEETPEPEAVAAEGPGAR